MNTNNQPAKEGQEPDENGLLPCPFCGGKVLLKQIGSNKLEIKCPKCIVKYIQKTLRYDCEWLLGKMQETWNSRSGGILTLADKPAEVLPTEGEDKINIEVPKEVQDLNEKLAVLLVDAARDRQEIERLKGLLEKYYKLCIAEKYFSNGIRSTDDNLLGDSEREWQTFKSENNL